MKKHIKLFTVVFVLFNVGWMCCADDNPFLNQTTTVLQANNPNITKDDVKNLLLKKVDPYLKRIVAEYHPKFPFIWKLAAADWMAAQDGPDDKSVCIPVSAIIEIQKGDKLSDSSLGILMHELTHVIKEHSQRKKDFRKQYSSKLSQKKFHEELSKLSRKCEWEADEGVPNDKFLLRGMKTYFERKKKFAEFSKNINSGSTTKTPYQSHPSHEERANRFAQRLSKLTVNEHLHKPHIRKLFGPDLPVPLDRLRPREMAQELEP